MTNKTTTAQEMPTMLRVLKDGCGDRADAEAAFESAVGARVVAAAATPEVMLELLRASEVARVVVAS